MKKLITRKQFACGLLLVFLAVFLVFYSLRMLHAINRNFYRNKEVRASRIGQIPYVGEYLKEFDSKEEFKYIEKSTFGTIEVLFTGHVSKQDIKKICESKQWDHISADSVKNSLGNIYKDFDVAEKDYPVSYTEEDAMIGRPLFQGIKLKINYIPSKNCITGKATVYNER